MDKYLIHLDVSHGQLEELMMALETHHEFRKDEGCEPENQQAVRHIQQIISKIEEQLEEQEYYEELY